MADSYKITGYDKDAQAVIVDAVVNGKTYTGKKKQFKVYSDTTEAQLNNFMVDWYESYKSNLPSEDRPALTVVADFPAEVKAMANQVRSFERMEEAPTE